MSQIIDSSLAYAMFTSRYEFSASFAISALVASESWISPRQNTRYNSAARSAHAGVSPPMTLLFSTISTMRRPGRTRSGQCATWMSGLSFTSFGKVRSGRAAASRRLSSSVVPGGEVDSSTTTAPGRSWGAIESAAAQT